MGANHRKACVAFAGLLYASVAGCTSSAPAGASQREHPVQHAAKPPAVSCPSKDFGTFLQRYADSADDSVRRSFTDDPLEYEVPTHTVEKKLTRHPLRISPSEQASPAWSSSPIVTSRMKRSLIESFRGR